jgi:hypothetical protein
VKKEEMRKLFNRLGGEDDEIISYPEFIDLFASKKLPRQVFWQKSKNAEFIYMKKPNITDVDKILSFLELRHDRKSIAQNSRLI